MDLPDNKTKQKTKIPLQRLCLTKIFFYCGHNFLSLLKLILAGYSFKASTVHASSNPKFSSNRNQFGNTQQDKLDTAETYFTDMQKMDTSDPVEYRPL